MIDNTYIPQPRTDIVLQAVEGESLILDNHNELIHQLNDTATFIWQHCDGSNNIANIMALLVEEYSISETNAMSDVLETINNFKHLNLLSMPTE